MKELCADQHRRTYVVNLDPAAEDLPYDCDVGLLFLGGVKNRHPGSHFDRRCGGRDEIGSQRRSGILHRVSQPEHGMARGRAFPVR